MNDKEKAQWLSDFYRRVAAGEEIWMQGEPTGKSWKSGPDLHSDPKCWSHEPLLRQIDLPHLIDSGLDCEFSNSGSIWFPQGPLLAIHDGKYDAKSEEWNNCQPRMSPHVHYWSGRSSVCPLPAGFVIQIHWDAGNGITRHEYDDYGNIQWFEVTAIRILRVADGYTLGGGE